MKKYCQDCDEEYDIPTKTNMFSCIVCGNPLSVIRSNPNSSNVTSVTTSSLQIANNAHSGLSNTVEGINFESFMSELIGNVDFQNLETSLRSQSTLKLSRQYLSTLGKVIVDKRGLILYNAYIQIGNISQPVKLMTTLAEFSPLLPQFEDSKHKVLISSETEPTTNKNEGTLLIENKELIISDPIYGDFNNNNNSENKMVLMDRGGISFVTKAKIAQKNNAVCLIVAQTYDIWPFVMTDNLNEISSSQFLLNIPIVMISRNDGENLKKLIQSCRHMTASLKIDEKCIQCAICCDDFLEGHEVLKLPCRHIFHSQCIHSWLDNHSNCPMCRFDMLTINNSEHRNPITSNNNSTSNNATQPYFI